MKKIILAGILSLAISPVFAQNGYQVSLQEVCMDIAGSAMDIAYQRDNGKSPRQFAEEMVWGYRQGHMDYDMLENISNIALLVYDNWRGLTPTQIGVEAYRTCMGPGI